MSNGKLVVYIVAIATFFFTSLLTVGYPIPVYSILSTDKQVKWQKCKFVISVTMAIATLFFLTSSFPPSFSLVSGTSLLTLSYLGRGLGRKAAPYPSAP